MAWGHTRHEPGRSCHHPLLASPRQCCCGHLVSPGGHPPNPAARLPQTHLSVHLLRVKLIFPPAIPGSRAAGTAHAAGGGVCLVTELLSSQFSAGWFEMQHPVWHFPAGSGWAFSHLNFAIRGSNRAPPHFGFVSSPSFPFSLGKRMGLGQTFPAPAPQVPLPAGFPPQTCPVSPGFALPRPGANGAARQACSLGFSVHCVSPGDLSKKSDLRVNKSARVIITRPFPKLLLPLHMRLYSSLGTVGGARLSLGIACHPCGDILSSANCSFNGAGGSGGEGLLPWFDLGLSLLRRWIPQTLLVRQPGPPGSWSESSLQWDAPLCQHHGAEVPGPAEEEGADTPKPGTGLGTGTGRALSSPSLCLWSQAGSTPGWGARGGSWMQLEGCRCAGHAVAQGRFAEGPPRAPMAP